MVAKFLNNNFSVTASLVSDDATDDAFRYYSIVSSNSHYSHIHLLIVASIARLLLPTSNCLPQSLRLGNVPSYFRARHPQHHK